MGGKEEEAAVHSHSFVHPPTHPPTRRSYSLSVLFFHCQLGSKGLLYIERSRARKGLESSV